MRIFVLFLTLTICCYSKVFRVGPDEQYKKPSQVAALVSDGDTVDILAGVYTKDACIWNKDKNNLLLRGTGGMAHLKSEGTCAGGKAIWVIQGKNTTIENIEFSEARVPDKNGAGIRQEGDGLVVRNCYFHHCEMGILSGASPTSDIYLLNSEFAYNGYGDGYSHNIYIGNIGSLTVKFCYTHHSKIGHNLKSRANKNYILYNKICDEMDGESSMNIDLPNGGFSLIIGNIIMQGPLSENSSMITYGLEWLKNPDSRLFVINNTIVNKADKARFIVINDTTLEAKVINNIFAGNDAETDKIVIGNAEILSNVRKTYISDLLFVDEQNYDYRLKMNSPALDAGIDPGGVNGQTLFPLAQYKHPLDSMPRIIYEAIDAGAYEYENPTGVLDNGGVKQEFSLNFNGIVIKTGLAATTKALKLKAYNYLGERVNIGYSITNDDSLTITSRLLPGIYILLLEAENSSKSLKLAWY